MILDKPTSREVELNGNSIVSMKEKQFPSFSRKNLGFVFPAKVYYKIVS